MAMPTAWGTVEKNGLDPTDKAILGSETLPKPCTDKYKVGRIRRLFTRRQAEQTQPAIRRRGITAFGSKSKVNPVYNEDAELTGDLFDIDQDSSADESEDDGFPSPIPSPAHHQLQVKSENRRRRRAPPPPPAEPPVPTIRFMRSPSPTPSPARLRPGTPDHLHRFTLFVRAIVGARMQYLLDPSVDGGLGIEHTIFVPSNEAMRLYAKRLGVSVDEVINNQGLSQKLVRTLAVSGRHSLESHPVSLQTIGGQTVVASGEFVRWSGCRQDAARVIQGKFDCTNGQIILIDTVPRTGEPLQDKNAKAGGVQSRHENKENSRKVTPTKKRSSLNPAFSRPRSSKSRLMPLQECASPSEPTTHSHEQAKFTNRFAAEVERCNACDKAVYATERFVIDGVLLHRNCFKCSECGCKVGPKSYAAHQGKHYCLPHFKRLFLLKGNYDEGFGTTQHKLKWLSSVTPSSPAGMC